MKITDRPGRIFALFFFSPTLLILSFRINSCDILTSNTLMCFSILLFGYESFWLISRPYEIRNF